jgi:hypothetical protein
MKKNVLFVCALLSLVVSSVLPAAAQSAQAPAGPTSTPALVEIYREEVRPGKGAAHAANEAAWAAAMAKGQAPVQWLAMTSMAGPGEAWFLSGHESYEAIQKMEDGMSGNAALSGENDKFSALDGELLNRTSRIITRFRPGLSYQPQVSLPEMRYMQVDIVRVKPGKIREFADSWRSTVAAHEKAKMDEHWAVYEADAGFPDGTFFFFYPLKSLAQLDKSGPMHSAAAYRDAVGEAGRIRMNEATVEAVDSSQTLLFALNAQMSLLSKQWIDADPAFWTPKPVPAPVAAARKPADKK